MSYTKHNYKKGDELLASQLNDMDDQIALNEQTADTLVTVSNAQPAAAKNRVWVKATPSEIEIPTMEDHNELSRQISDVGEAVNNSNTHYGQIQIQFTNGEYIKLGGDVYVGKTIDITQTITDTNSRYAIVDCSPGDIFYISGTGANWRRVYGMLDVNNTLLYVSGVDVSYSNEKIVIPDSVTKIIIEGVISDLASFKGEYKTIINTNEIAEMQSPVISDVGEWEQGSIFGSPPYNDAPNDARIRTKRIYAKAGSVFTVNPNGQSIYCYLFNMQGSLVSKSQAWENKSETYFLENDGYFRCVVAAYNTTDNLTPSDRLAYITMYTPFATNLNIAVNTYSEPDYNYTGERITIGKHKAYSEHLFTALATGQIQGCELYGSEVFAFIPPNTIRVLNAYTGATIQDITISGLDNDCHGNTLQFAPYPNLYISGYYDDKIYRVELTKTGSSYSGTVTATYSLSELTNAGLGYSDGVVDVQENLLYVIKYNNAGSYEKSETNRIIVSSFKLPNASTALQDNDVIDQFSIDSIFAKQQCVLNGGIIYMISGDGMTEAGLHLINPATKTIRNSVNIKKLTNNQEPEGIIVRDSDIMIMSKTYSTGRIDAYSLTF